MHVLLNMRIALLPVASAKVWSKGFVKSSSLFNFFTLYMIVVRHWYLRVTTLYMHNGSVALHSNRIVGRAMYTKAYKLTSMIGFGIIIRHNRTLTKILQQLNETTTCEHQLIKLLVDVE